MMAALLRYQFEEDVASNFYRGTYPYLVCIGNSIDGGWYWRDLKATQARGECRWGLSPGSLSQLFLFSVPSDDRGLEAVVVEHQPVCSLAGWLQFLASCLPAGAVHKPIQVGSIRE